MKTNALTRTLAGIFAAAMLCSSVSCGSAPKDEENPNGGGSNNNSGSISNASSLSDKTISNSYSSIEITKDIPLSYVNTFDRLGDDKYIIIGSNNKENSEVYISDAEFSSFEKVDLGVTLPENGTSYSRSCILGNGNVAVLLTIVDYGDFKLPDYSDPNFDDSDFDYEAMQEAAKYSTYLIIIDKDGKVISKNEPSGFDEYKNEEDGTVSFGNLAPIGEDNMLVGVYTDAEDYTFVMDSEGKNTSKLSKPITLYGGFCLDKDKNLLYSDWSENGYSVLKKIGASDYKTMDGEISLKDLESSSTTMIKGKGDYELFIVTNTAVYGIKADNTIDEVVNWVNSDINGSYICAMVALDDGDFITYERNWDTGDSVISRITKRDEAEIANTEVITIAVMYADSGVTSKVTEFNKKNNGLRIKLKDYSNYYEYDEQKEKATNTPAKQLKMDLVSGEKPDMICCYDTNVMNSIAKKGALADLSEIMETGGGVKKTDIMPNVLQTLTLDDKLYYIAPTFSVETMAVKKKLFDKENWTLDDLIETYKKMPEGAGLFSYGSTKNAVFENLYYNMNFIDDVNGSCSFDSPDFIKLLEFANTFSDESNEPDWETSSDEEMQAYYSEQECAYMKDKALVYSLYLSSGREYAQCKQGTFGDDVTLVGYPSEDGKGAKISFGALFAIMDESEHKSECWDFISSFFDYSDNEKNSYYNFPVVASEFDKTMDKTMDRPFYTDEDGKKQYYDDTFWLSDDKEIEIKPLTQEERDYVANYIKNTSGRSTYYNEDVYNIVREETEPFFKGERTAQETAELIQNRASIILSEQN